MSDTQLDAIERFREQLGYTGGIGYDVWFDGDDIGDELRRVLDELLDEVRQLRKAKP